MNDLIPVADQISASVNGTLQWAMIRGQEQSAIYPDVIYLVFAVGYNLCDYRFARQKAGTKIPGRVRPIAAFRDGRLVSDEVPVISGTRQREEMEPLTIPLPWDPKAEWKVIRRAFLMWTKTGHPDVGGDEQTFRAVGQRYRKAEEKEERRKAKEAEAEKAARKKVGALDL